MYETVEYVFNKQISEPGASPLDLETILSLFFIVLSLQTKYITEDKLTFVLWNTVFFYSCVLSHLENEPKTVIPKFICNNLKS